MRYTVFETPVIQPALRAASLALLKLMGFRIEGRPPDLPKYVAIVAPHTSNWDFLILLAMAFALRINARWFGKNTLFRWPLRGLFRWFGGVPIDRGKSERLVSQYVQAFDARDQFVLAVAPEGTRRKVVAWRTGFYHIAVGANVPIAFVFLDYRKKAGGFGPVFVPTGDLDADMKTIKAFYATVTAKYPDQAG